MDRCWLLGQLGDALHTVLCATRYNLRWLLREMVRLGLKAAFLRPLLLTLWASISGRQTLARVGYAPTRAFRAGR
jgi:IS5 family transposase